MAGHADARGDGDPWPHGHRSGADGRGVGTRRGAGPRAGAAAVRRRHGAAGGRRGPADRGPRPTAPGRPRAADRRRPRIAGPGDPGTEGHGHRGAPRVARPWSAGTASRRLGRRSSVSVPARAGDPRGPAVLDLPRVRGRTPSRRSDPRDRRSRGDLRSDRRAAVRRRRTDACGPFPGSGRGPRPRSVSGRSATWTR